MARPRRRRSSFKSLHDLISYRYFTTGSPAGLSRVNGVHAVVVLKHETSTIRQRHNFISIDLTFGVSDYVREVTSPDKVGSGPMSGRDATWGQHLRALTFLFVFVLVFYIFFNRATAHDFMG